MNGVKIENYVRKEILPAPWYKRVLNFLIDSALIVLLGRGFLFLYINITQSVLADETFYTVAMILSILVALFVYYSLWEGTVGRTPAKLITGTKVFVRQNTTQPTLVDGLLRTLGRVIPFDFISFFSARPSGWHDSISGTFVGSSKFSYEKRSGARLTPKQLAMFRNKHIGFVFQFHHLLPEFSALENVCIPGWLAGRSKEEVKEEAIRLLNMFGLAGRLENKPNQLSGGEQQRVAVARALINHPDIVFADEPTGNLDSANARELHRLFFELRDKFNQTFLIVTHNEELAQLSDRIFYMKDGKIALPPEK
ncbi:MAG: ATP-binding cassette domain-containing protein [Chitinophagaceae bacterium]